MAPLAALPFAGLLMGVVRAWLWGVLFSRFGGELELGLLPHALTVLLEGEAYVVAMLGVWLWWWPVLRTSLRLHILARLLLGYRAISLGSPARRQTVCS